MDGVTPHEVAFARGGPRIIASAPSFLLQVRFAMLLALVAAEATAVAALSEPPEVVRSDWQRIAAQLGSRMRRVRMLLACSDGAVIGDGAALETIRASLHRLDAACRAFASSGTARRPEAAMDLLAAVADIRVIGSQSGFRRRPFDPISTGPRRQTEATTSDGGGRGACPQAR
jgi:hypothetical protein